MDYSNEPVDKMSPAPKITSYDVIFEYFQLEFTI